jgi:hypothetical protein
MRPFTTGTFGNVSYDVLRRDTRRFEQLAAYKVNPAVLGQGTEAREVRAGYASANLFSFPETPCRSPCWVMPRGKPGTEAAKTFLAGR